MSNGARPPDRIRFEASARAPRSPTARRGSAVAGRFRAGRAHRRSFLPPPESSRRRARTRRWPLRTSSNMPIATTRTGWPELIRNGRNSQARSKCSSRWARSAGPATEGIHHAQFGSFCGDQPMKFAAANITPPSCLHSQVGSSLNSSAATSISMSISNRVVGPSSGFLGQTQPIGTRMSGIASGMTWSEPRQA